MQCTNCGNEVPAGSVACPFCGTAAPMDAQPYQATAPAPASNSKKGIIIAIAAVVAIVAIVVILKVFVFGGSKDGTYVYDDLAAFGVEMSIEVDGEDCKMIVSATYEGQTESEEAEGTIKFDGDTAKITIDGETMEAKYDSKEKTITIEDSGIKMVFKKK